MSRIRTIKPEFWVSEQVVECSIPARLLFIGIWNFADDQGVIPASAKQLKMQIYPGDDFTVAQVMSMVNELLAQGLLAEFERKSKCYWHVTGWHHQLINRPSKSRHPAPPTNGNEALTEDSGTDHGSLTEDSVSNHGINLEHSGTDHGSLITGREGIGKEGIGKERKVFKDVREPDELPSVDSSKEPIDVPDGTSPPKSNGSGEKQEAKGGKVWDAYALVYHDRYGTEPVRNKKVNSQICHLVDRLGQDAAAVAGFYVRSNNAYYVKRGHAVDCLLADAEKLRTEWATGRQITNTYAKNLDQHQETADMTQRLIEKYRREGKLIEEPGNAN